MAHRPQPRTPPLTRPSRDGGAAGRDLPGAAAHPLGPNPLGPNPSRSGRFLLAAIPAAVIGALLALAGSAAPVAAAGNSPSACTGTLGGLLVSGGSGQAAKAGTAFADPLAAEVVDTGGCPLSNVNVAFVAPTSGPGATFPGAATTATVTSGSDGIATAPSLTANDVSGSYTVPAEVEGTGYEVSFELDNTTSGVATSVGVSSGNDQSAQVGQQFALPLVVNVFDSYGAPVGGCQRHLYRRPDKRGRGQLRRWRQLHQRTDERNRRSDEPAPRSRTRAPALSPSRRASAG